MVARYGAYHLVAESQPTEPGEADTAVSEGMTNAFMQGEESLPAFWAQFESFTKGYDRAHYSP
jgi:hypothetical protein